MAVDKIGAIAAALIAHGKDQPPRSRSSRRAPPPLSAG
ncbi:hypothetical protein SMICM17S_03895 [Streptomyces microflavus]